MSYVEPDCCYCKKAQKRLILTEYKDQCECCQKIDRLVEYTWEDDEEE